MEAGCGTSRTSRGVWITLIATWVVASIVTRLVLKNGFLGLVVTSAAPLWLRTAIALLPIIPATLVVIAFIRDIRNQDEFERRLHLEALAFAFPATVLVLMTLGLVEVVIDLNAEDWSYRHIWPYVMMFWVFGYLQARTRYGMK